MFIKRYFRTHSASAVFTLQKKGTVSIGIIKRKAISCWFLNGGVLTKVFYMTNHQKEAHDCKSEGDW